jgi:hypothetical protein
MQFYVTHLKQQGHFGAKTDFLCVFWLTVVKGSELHFFIVLRRALYAFPGKDRNRDQTPFPGHHRTVSPSWGMSCSTRGLLQLVRFGGGLAAAI